LAFGRPWRQTEGRLRSIATLLGANLEIPDHTTFARRSIRLPFPTARLQKTEPIHVVLDSTGLMVYGTGEGRGRNTASAGAGRGANSISR
jgi:hypothetical protein